MSTGGDELASAAKQRVRLDGEARPGRPWKRAAQRRQQRAIRARQPPPDTLAAQDRQLMAEEQDLQLLRATRPRQQPHQREQIPHDEIQKRPEQARAFPRRWREGRRYRPPLPSRREPRTSLRTLRARSVQLCWNAAAREAPQRVLWRPW